MKKEKKKALATPFTLGSNYNADLKEVSGFVV